MGWLFFAKRPITCYRNSLKGMYRALGRSRRQARRESRFPTRNRRFYKKMGLL